MALRFCTLFDTQPEFILSQSIEPGSDAPAVQKAAEPQWERLTSQAGRLRLPEGVRLTAVEQPDRTLSPGSGFKLEMEPLYNAEETVFRLEGSEQDRLSVRLQAGSGRW